MAAVIDRRYRRFAELSDGGIVSKDTTFVRVIREIHGHSWAFGAWREAAPESKKKVRTLAGPHPAFIPMSGTSILHLA
jgi:hypothetical protein